MLRKSLLALAVFALSGGLSQAQEFPGGPRYDGVVTLVRLTGAACTDVPYAADQKFSTIYRAKLDAQLSEAMELRVPRGLLFMLADFDETFEGANQRAHGTFIIDAFRGTPPDAIFDLTFTPPITDTTDQFRFTGTWRNFIEDGCTASIRDVFNKRV